MTIVKEATNWHAMAGDTPLEKMINAYLTDWFILRYDVPADECLREARKVIAIVRAYGEMGDSGAAWDELGREDFPAAARDAPAPDVNEGHV